MLDINSSLSGASNFILTPTICEYIITGENTALVKKELIINPMPSPNPKPDGSAQCTQRS